MADEAVNSVVGKVLDLLFGVAKREIGYIWNSRENVEKFKNEVEKLKVLRGRVQQLIDVAEHNGDTLSYGLQDWMDKVDDEILKAENFLDQEANAKKTCINWSTLYHYGKMATHKVPSFVDHIEGGKSFESCVSVPTSKPGFLEFYERKDFRGMNTQKSTLNSIIEAFKDENMQIIGIYGAGGVGKTTLAHEAAATVKNLFDDMVYIVVSENVDVEKIKDMVNVAAKRVQEKDKILIILDDVRKEVNLSALGIPCGAEHMNCKILLTSRSKNVCEAMNTHSNICVKSLPEEEAWILFKRVVGEKVDASDKLKQIAMEAVDGCGGLPLIIQVVGNVLKKQRINLWEVTLAQLNNNVPSIVPLEMRGSFTHLKLSYDLLDSEEAKLCFLLCSMFPEREFIPLERLARYCVGLGKLNRLRSMEDARKRVGIAVDNLKSFSLFLNGKDKFTTKMHDVVREVAHIIASEGKNIFLVEAGTGLSEWITRKNDPNDYTGISLMQNNLHKLPDYVLHFPLLEILLVQENCKLSNITDEFIEAIKEVKVLDMEHNNLSSLPKSVKQLVKIRMLNLGGNSSLQEISILGELGELEILILNDTNIHEIPQEIGKLDNLRRLEVKRCTSLSHIAPGVISNLRWLEELCIGYYQVQKENYNSLSELCNLSKLRHLNLFVTDYDLIPEGVQFGKLEEFVIKIGNNDENIVFPWELKSKHLLILAKFSLNITFLPHIEELIKVSDCILMHSVSNLNDILPNVYYEASHELKTIALLECCSDSYLVDTKYWDELFGTGKIQERFFSRLEHLKLSSLKLMSALWKCPDAYISLSKLVTLDIGDCPKLVRLFSVSVTRGLVNLKNLSISKCHCLEEVIWTRDADTGSGEIDMAIPDADIVFPRLTHITFSDLSKLERFYSGYSSIKYPSLVEVSIVHCPIMEIWGYGVHDTPKLKFLGNVPLDGTLAINDAVIALSKVETL